METQRSETWQRVWIHGIDSAEFVEVQHACFVERNICAFPRDSVSAKKGDVVVFLGKLNRHARAMRKELGEGPSLRQCREKWWADG